MLVNFQTVKIYRNQADNNCRNTRREENRQVACDTQGNCPKNEIRFYYSLDGEVKFVEKIKFGFAPIWEKVNQELLDKVLFNLHLALGISYWKTYCPKKLIIKSGCLTQEQAAFWNKLYLVYPKRDKTIPRIVSFIL